MKKNNKDVNAVTLFIRVAIGAYLIWLAYSLIPAFSKYDGLSRIAFILFAIIFVSVGSVLAVTSIKKYLKKEYLMPGYDESDEEESIEDNSDSINRDEK